MKLRVRMPWRVMVVLAVAIVAIAAAAVVALDTLTRFDGEIYVTSKQPERAVVRPAQDRPWWAKWGTVPVQYGLEPSQLPFADPATSGKLVSTAPSYDVAMLPFPLELRRTEILHETEATNILAIQGSEEKREVVFRPGQDIPVGGKTWHIQTIKKWTGLLSDSRGEPMVSLSLRRPEDNEWTQGIAVASGTWRLAEPSIGLHFEWFDSEDAARQLTRIEAASPARWGIVEGRSVTWFDSFNPGMGEELRDGTVITLVQTDTQRVPPAIEVEIARKGKTSREWVPVNQHSANARFLYEDFSKLDTVIMLSAWSDDSVFATAHHKGQPCGQTVLATGKEWMPSGLPYRLRVEQVLRQAVAVDDAHSTLAEVTLASGADVLRVREGEAVRFGDNLFAFSRKANPPQVLYEVSVTEKDAKPTVLRIEPDDRVRFRGCTLAQSEPGKDPSHAAVLRVTVAPHRIWPRMILVFALVMAVIAVVWARPAEHRPTEPAESTEDPTENKETAEPQE